jgi:hypothetical protein
MLVYECPTTAAVLTTEIANNISDFEDGTMDQEYHTIAPILLDHPDVLPVFFALAFPGELSNNSLLEQDNVYPCLIHCLDHFVECDNFSWILSSNRLHSIEHIVKHDKIIWILGSNWLHWLDCLIDHNKVASILALIFHLPCMVLDYVQKFTSFDDSTLCSYLGTHNKYFSSRIH